MAFRRWICGDLVHKQGIQALWTESEQASRRCMSIMKKGKTLERLTVADLDRPEIVMQKRKNSGK